MTTQENLKTTTLDTRKLKTTTLDTETHLELRQQLKQLKQLKHDSSNPSQNNEFQEKELPMDGLLPAPPPLSSRRENHYSKDGSPKNDNAPEIPPSDLPPPVPPRKKTMFDSLKRCQSVSPQQPTRHLSGHFQNLNATLPRCSAMERERPTINVSSGQDSVFDSLPHSVMGLKELRPRITTQAGKQNFFKR